MAQDNETGLQGKNDIKVEQKKQPLVLSPKEHVELKSAITTENTTQKKQVVDTKPSTYNEKLAAERVEELKNKPIEGKFDAKHIKDINKYILQDSKELKGGSYRPDNGNQLRDRKIFGTDTTFKMQFETGAMSDKRVNAIMKEFGTVEAFAKLDEKMAADKLSKVYGDLEKLGAFEKGNSKTARTFTEQIAATAGYSIDWSKINQYEKERALGQDNKLALAPQTTKNEKVAVKQVEAAAVKNGKEHDGAAPQYNGNFMRDFAKTAPVAAKLGLSNTPYSQGKSSSLNEVKIAPSLKSPALNNGQVKSKSVEKAPSRSR